MPLSPVREVHSPTSAAAAQRQMEARRLFSPGTRGAQSQPRATGRGFAAVSGRAGRGPQPDRGGRSTQRGGRRRDSAQRDDQPNGTSKLVGLLSAALGQDAEAANGVPHSAVATHSRPAETVATAGSHARGTTSATESDGGFRGHGRTVSRGRRGREAAPAGPPELARVSPNAMASVASSDTASTVSAPSGHASRTDTDTGRQYGRGEGGRGGRSRCPLYGCMVSGARVLLHLRWMASRRWCCTEALFLGYLPSI
jgi:hypothetical protein